MAETAVGLFDNAEVAEAVVHRLGAIGFPKEGIRVLVEPAGLPVNSATSTPLIDFEAALTRDLHAMGASDAECETFVDGIRHGNALVFASGSKAQAYDAADLMSAHAAIEVEEFDEATPVLPSTLGESTVTLAPRRQAGEAKVRKEGVRVFAW